MNGRPPLPLNHLPLRPSSLTIFQRRGFVTTAELEESKNAGGMTNLAAELGVSLSEAAGLLREVQGAMNASSSTDGTSKTAKELLSNPISSLRTRVIVTFCRSIDKLIGGGVALGEVTEIVGLPGVGKTQLAMQLCVDASLPIDHGGVAGQAVYIDTEGSFSPERCFSMAQAFVNHVQMSSRRRNMKLPMGYVAEKVLGGIHVYRVHDETAQTATIYSLPTFLEQRKQQGNPVRLVIVDSIAFHYRCAPTGKDYMERSRGLSSVSACLADIASNFDVAVVVMNQMTTKFGAADDQMKLVPALGESWAHAMTTRMILSVSPPDSVVRKCTLVKSPHRPSDVAYYQVVEEGIRDVAVQDKPSSDTTKRVRTQY